MGLSISGEEVIGRLWIFASKLTGSEETNAKESMVSGLKDSYDEFMGKVCNPGKVQRLVVGVLQGRLPGVNIELMEGRVAKVLAVGSYRNVAHIENTG